MVTEELRGRLQRIKLVAMDIDGVLTDGRIIYGDYGDELKFFDVQDGFGIVLLRRAGFRIVIITAKKSRVNHRRAKELKVHRIEQNVRDKRRALEKALRKFRLQPEEACYIGDDLVDLPALGLAGLAVAVSNAVEDVRQRAHYVTAQPGGRGAVREVADLLLKAQNKWAEATLKYFS